MCQYAAQSWVHLLLHYSALILVFINYFTVCSYSYLLEGVLSLSMLVRLYTLVISHGVLVAHSSWRQDWRCNQVQRTLTNASRLSTRTILYGDWSRQITKAALSCLKRQYNIQIFQSVYTRETDTSGCEVDNKVLHSHTYICTLLVQHVAALYHPGGPDYAA